MQSHRGVPPPPGIPVQLGPLFLAHWQHLVCRLSCRLASSMIPFRFGPIGQQLFGVCHPVAGAPARLGVLLCNPFGQEAIRVHRLYRVLADRLAKVGIASMRFDYFGTGESDGDDLDGSLDRWRTDIHLADQTLRQQCACDHIVWVGARLGGTLACLASHDAPQAPEGLILWEPVLNGPAYLRALAKEHAKAIASPYRAPVPPAGAQPASEALGFAMSDALIDQLAQVRPDKPLAARTHRLHVIAKPDDQATRDWIAHQQARQSCTLRTMAVDFDWTSEEAMNTALVPPTALQMLSKTIEEMAP
jgi:alpha-beta hydrolase superfamily lysophospholipase